MNGKFMSSLMTFETGLCVVTIFGRGGNKRMPYGVSNMSQDFIGMEHPLATLIVEKKLQVITRRNLGVSPHEDEYVDFEEPPRGVQPQKQNDIHWTFTSPFFFGDPDEADTDEPGLYHVEMSFWGPQANRFHTIEYVAGFCCS